MGRQLNNSEIKKIFYNTFNGPFEFLAKSAFERYEKIHDWNLNNWTPICIEEMNRLIEYYYYLQNPLDAKDVAENYKPSLEFLKLGLIENFNWFNKYFFQKYKKTESKRRIESIFSILDDFIQKINPGESSKGNLLKFKRHIKVYIFHAFVNIFNQEFMYNKNVVDPLEKMKNEKIILRATFKKYRSSFEKHAKNTSDLVSQFGAFKGIHSISDHERLITIMSNSLTTLNNPIVDEYYNILNNLEKFLNIQASEQKHTSSYFTPRTYKDMLLLYAYLKYWCFKKYQITFDVFDIGKLLGLLHIEFGIYPEDELNRRRKEYLIDAFPDAKSLNMITIDKIKKLYKYEYEEKEIIEIYNDNELIAEKYAEAFKTTHKRHFKELEEKLKNHSFKMERLIKLIDNLP